MKEYEDRPARACWESPVNEFDACIQPVGACVTEEGHE